MRNSAFVAVDGGYDVHLREEIRELLAQLTHELRDLLLVGDDEGLRRLYPTPYPDDPKRNEEFVAFEHDQLLAARLQALDIVDESLESERLTDEQLNCWMRVFNEMRLVLGTRLDISEDDHRPRDPDDPDAPAFELYRLLTYVVAEAIDALATDLGWPEDFGETEPTTFEDDEAPE